MCRLLGHVTRTPIPLAELLGEADLFQFTELSGKHGDGWGIASATDAGVQVVKAPDAARTSDVFGRQAHASATDLGLVHLRWATLGLSVMSENTHPFTDGTIAFAHNGSVAPPSALDALIPDELRPLRRGDTDSERYFLATLAEARRTNPVEGLAATVARITESYEFSSLNAMIATPEELIAVCRYDPIAQEKEDEPDYYHLRFFRATPDSVVVSSTGWGSGWTPLENGEILVVRRGTLDVSVRSVTDAWAAR
jgi:predicted glutamine amidotransferase